MFSYNRTGFTPIFKCSSLVTQTISSVHNRFKLWTLDIFRLCLRYRFNIELF